MASSERQSSETQYPYLEGGEEGSVDISKAEEVLARAEAGEASTQEINEMVKTLQGLQNDGIRDTKIQIALTRLIAARETSAE